jgi:hypothetical protein
MEQKIPGIFGANASPPTFVSLDNEPEPFSTPRLTVLDSCNRAYLEQSSGRRAALIGPNEQAKRRSVRPVNHWVKMVKFTVIRASVSTA